MVITFTISELWLRAIFPHFDSLHRDEGALRRAIKETIKQALRSGRDATTCQADDDGPRIRIHLSFPEPEAGMLRAGAAKAGLGHNQFVKQLIGAMALHPPDALAPDMNLSINQLVRDLAQQSPTVKDRPEQVRMFSNLQDAMQRSMIGIIEGSTGVGKSRAIMCSAVDWVHERETHVVIAAPTIALVRQYAAEWATQATVRDMPQLRLVFGKREFVSQLDLTDFLDSPGGKVWDSAAIREWMAGGAMPDQADKGVEVRWLCHSLERIVPGFPMDEVRLTDIVMEGDSGLQAYKAQFLDNSDCGEIFVCTHAMLAQHMRMRMIAAGRDDDFKAIAKEISAVFNGYTKAKAAGDAKKAEHVEQLQALYAMQGDAFKDVEGGLLPLFNALFVDEAHVLEEQFSNALTEYLSLQSINRTLEAYRAAGGRVAKATVDDIHKCIAALGQQGHAVQGDVINLASSAPVTQALKTTLTQLAAEISAIALPKNTENMEKRLAAARLRRAAVLLRLASSHGDARSYLRFSPVRAYPQLYIGRSNVSNVLSLMWNAVDAGAAISATMYLNTGNGEASAFYQKLLLSIPPARAAEYPPVEAPWLHESIRTLWIPEAELAKALRPPTRADKLNEAQLAAAEEAWLRALADTLAYIHARSEGGVLVLMTAYAHIKFVSALLRDAVPGIALVAADGDTNVTKQKVQFLELMRNGQKAMWLAVGAAWTGLDVGGHEPWSNHFGESLRPEDDNVLTTLVIPRLPFGTNNTITHIWRKNNKPSTPWELFEAAFRFKQGLGRLIRRVGLPKNRDIYVLDGRLADPVFDRATPLFEKIMVRYPVQRLRALTGEADH
ncbi:type IV CRISPR-associated DEAD/DEAH-box helicase Csf4 [Duganella vulcania]|uniref:Helicase ATP-binding domain-containing protein n=1 Tax=Duganella vulcania TaxID=2692166 RepID=A0A845GIY4_9BURK|nr:type IV CRISPR-associated DEAD/DEAH-box helicase Csf4 [Duganella vulcania]MYM92619.1 hypothetical protein [Duganella vulcania]